MPAVLKFENEVKDPPSVRIRPLPSTTTWPTQSYSSVAVDEIELASDYGTTPVHHDSPKPSRWARTPNEIISQSPWIHKYFWVDTWNDVKKFPMAWLGRRFLSHVLPLGVMAGLIYLLFDMFFLAPPFYDNMNSGSVCLPDGSFELSSADYNPWTRNAIFTININFGSYSFDIAKLIDICWDVGVARGGQGLLAFFTYLGFTKALSRIMESSTVPYSTFSAISLHHNTAASVIILIRDFLKTSGVRAKLAMAWIIFAASFVLFSTTWLSAMTGYTADIQPYILDKQNTLVPVGMFQPVVYTIHDASRFNNSFQDDHQVIVPWSDAAAPSLSTVYGCSPLTDSSSVSPGNDTIDFSWSNGVALYEYLDVGNDLNCKWMWAVSKYVHDWGFLATSPIRNTTFQRPDKSNLTTAVFFDPPLNISAYPTSEDFDTSDYGWWYIPYGPTWRDPGSNQHPYNLSNPAFYYSGSQTLYNLTELNEQGSCQQEGLVRYKWGFSFVLLFAFAAALLVWSIGMWALYLDSWLHSSLDLLHREMGTERAVLDLARSMETNLDVDQVELQSNSQLKNLIKGNTITYSDLPIQSATISRWTKVRWWWRDFSTRRWIKDERWWLCAFAFFTLMLSLSQTTGLERYWTPWFSVFPTLGVLIVLAVGREVRSRWLFFAVLFLLFCILDFWWIPWSYQAGLYEY